MTLGVPDGIPAEEDGAGEDPGPDGTSPRDLAVLHDGLWALVAGIPPEQVRDAHIEGCQKRDVPHDYINKWGAHALGTVDALLCTYLRAV